ncbi:hypothetical protein ACI2I2_24300 [Scandinavium sp. NPDC088450]|uniref:hypothetical protein n=1 Tax=Scandinavium sp. NPDC088450 TaxID=3364514 RepID=UPI00384DDC8F
MKAFTIRRMTETDLDVFRELRLEALHLHPEAFGTSYEECSQKPMQFFAEQLQTSHVFGGFDVHNTLQGMIGVSCSSLLKLSHVANIWGMYVRAGKRGAGALYVHAPGGYFERRTDSIKFQYKQRITFLAYVFVPLALKLLIDINSIMGRVTASNMAFRSAASC